MEKAKNLEVFFKQADTFMILIGRDEAIIDMNLKALKDLSTSKPEILGKNWFDTFVPEAGRTSARTLFHDMLGGALRHVHMQYVVKSKAGQELTLNFHNILVSDKEGNTIGVLSSADKASERQPVETSAKEIESRLRISLDSMIEGCQIIDYDWRYVYVNDAVAKQGRKTKQELLGYTMMQAYPGIDRTSFFGFLRNCMANRVPQRIENEFTFADGSKGWFDLHMEPVPEGVLILSIDITKSRLAEIEINNYRQRLEQVVAERTAECAKVNEKLERVNLERMKIEEGLELRSLVLDNSKEAVLLANIKGDFVYVNAAAVKTYGYTIGEFYNFNIRQLMPKEDASSVDRFLKRIVEKGETNFEMVHLKKNNARMHVKLYSNIIRTHRGQFILVIIQETYD